MSYNLFFYIVNIFNIVINYHFYNWPKLIQNYIILLVRISKMHIFSIEKCNLQLKNYFDFIARLIKYNCLENHVQT